jgi:hypothetical protein
MMHCFSLDVEVDLYEQFFSFYLMVGVPTNHIYLVVSVGEDTNR